MNIRKITGIAASGALAFSMAACGGEEEGVGEGGEQEGLEQEGGQEGQGLGEGEVIE